MIGANVSAFSIGKAVGRGGGGLVPLQWNNTAGAGIIAQRAGQFIRYGAVSNSPTTGGLWQYKLSSGGSWAPFGGPFTVIDVGAPIIQTTVDGQLFQYIHISSNWSAGNTNYIQRIYPDDVYGNGYSYGETAALANNAGNFGTASNYSFF